jgi:hypothetical protein
MLLSAMQRRFCHFHFCPKPVLSEHMCVQQLLLHQSILPLFFMSNSTRALSPLLFWPSSARAARSLLRSFVFFSAHFFASRIRTNLRSRKRLLLLFYE